MNPSQTSQTPNNDYSEKQIKKPPSPLSIQIWNTTDNSNNFNSPICTYFGSSHYYLNRKYSDNHFIDYNQNKNFLRKDSLYQEDENKDYDEEDECDEYKNIQGEMNYQMKKYEQNDENTRISPTMNNIDDNEYTELNADGNYYNTNIDINAQQFNYGQNSQNLNNINNGNIPWMRFNLNHQYPVMSFAQIKMFSRPRFNSGNNMNMTNYLNNQIINGNNYNININEINNKNSNYDYSLGTGNMKYNKYTIEMFGRKGWICSMCNNFNYDTRNKCNRCKVSKNPKIIKKNKFTVNYQTTNYQTPRNETKMNNNNNNMGNHGKNPNHNRGNQMSNDSDITSGSHNALNGLDINSMNKNKGITSMVGEYTINHSNNNNGNSLLNYQDTKVKPLLNQSWNNYHVNQHSLHNMLNTNNPQNEENFAVKNTNNTWINKPNTIAESGERVVNSESFPNQKSRSCSELLGDWICTHCKNVNLSVMNTCKKCKRNNDKTIKNNQYQEISPDKQKDSNSVENLNKREEVESNQ